MKITICRICCSNNIHKVIDLGFHPLADTFLPEHLDNGPEVAYPLQLGSCQDCGHIFTLYAISPENRYQKQDYSYDSSNSKVSILHFKNFCDSVLKDAHLKSDSLIVDIGSNVGTLLSHFKDSGYSNILGVEPSPNISKVAIASGIPTLQSFFDTNATTAINKIKKVDVLLGANVVNHADDLVGLLKCAKEILSFSGIFVFEVPYLLDLIKGTAFDTIYHEHVHYYGIKPLSSCLKREGFSIYKIEHLDYMCGSVRIYTRIGGAHSDIVANMISEEEDFLLYKKSTYDDFMTRVLAVKLSVNEYLWRIRSEGGKIIGIGAATKGNTLLNYCGLDADLISYITDASPLKIGKFTPGSHIPIISDADIDEMATHALILPWNIASFLKEKLSHLNIQFYVPQVETLHK